MYLKVVDGNVIFGIYFIDAVIPVEQISLFPCQTEEDGILCYYEEEKNQVEGLLIRLNIPFTTRPISPVEEHVEKVKDVKYNSRTEAIMHLQNEVDEPESEIISNLKKEKEDLKNKLQQTEDALLTIMFGG